MKQNVLIISHNNIGVPFWKHHITNPNIHIERVKSSDYKKELLTSTSPSLIIVDSYFQTEENAISHQKLLTKIHLQNNNLPLFHFSPHYSSSITSCYNIGNLHQSVICEKTFDVIRQILTPNYTNHLTA